jgi:hypothetical protein
MLLLEDGLGKRKKPIAIQLGLAAGSKIKRGHHTEPQTNRIREQQNQGKSRLPQVRSTTNPMEPTVAASGRSCRRGPRHKHAALPGPGRNGDTSDRLTIAPFRHQTGEARPAPMAAG